jgi:Uma2 family endonuclease
MTESQRRHVVNSLPSEFPASEAAPPEGDHHFDAVVSTRSSLRGHFRRMRRRIYIGNDLPIYYPGENMFSPDLIAVLDVEDGPRNSWIVSQEGKGLDLALEIHWLGHRLKDFEHNLQKYARLGISEYFVIDLRKHRLKGYRLSTKSYQPVLAQGGRLPSEVLGLDLALEDGRVRFYVGMAALPDADDLVKKLDATASSWQARAEQEAARAEHEAARAEHEAARAEHEAARAKHEATRADQETARANLAERKLAEALARISELEKVSKPRKRRS